jgi:DNA polymerase-3 subunit alpha
MVIYSELFDTLRSSLKEDQLLLVEAKVFTKGGDEESGGNLRIIADKLYDLADARSRHAKSMKLNCSGLSNTGKLKELLAPYRMNSSLGSTDKNINDNRSYCPVSVTYRNQGAVCELELGDAWRVNLQDGLLQSLSAHFQTENVRVIY